MAQAPLTDAQKWAVVKAMRGAPHVGQAAIDAGINENTFRARLRAMRADPVWSKRLPKPVEPGAKYDPAAATSRTARAQTLERENEALRGQLRDARAAKKRWSKPAKSPAKLKSDIVRVIFPDVHGSYQDKAAVAAFLADAKRIDPDELIGLGDIMDCGGYLATHHVLGFVAQADYSFENDLAAANAFLDRLQTACPRASLTLIEGNHERRIETQCVTWALRNRRDAQGLLDRNGPEAILNVKARGATWVRQDRAYDGLPTQGTILRGKCLFTHGTAVGAGAPFAMLKKHGMSVMFGHTHRSVGVVESSTSSSAIGAWTIGCLSERQPLWRHTDPTSWVHGYAIQLQSRRTGHFLTIPVPIVDGHSLFPGFQRG